VIERRIGMEKTRHFPVIIEQDRDGTYIIECSLFEGCRSYGETVDEALDNIREAIAVCMDEYDMSEPDTVFLGVRDIELAV
jgi:predicted RNase H-like HicB family nuclease